MVSVWRARFAELHDKGIDLGLERMGKVLDALPIEKLKGHIHVAGTNGKGGVVRTLEQGFLDAGERIATYTSPFLWRFEENIRLNGKPIDSKTCAAYFAQVWDARGQTPLTWFEADTLVAFLAMADHGGQAIVECGMGGGRDATALCGTPIAAVLTNVGGDHAEFLGDDPQLVTQEKAAMAKGAPLFVPHNFAYDLSFVEDLRRTKEPLAEAVLSHMGLPLPTTPIVQTGRWQRVGDSIFDVGHNAHAARYLAAKLAQEPGPYLLEIGMLRRKDARAFLEAFVPLNPYIQAVDLGDEGHPFAYLENLAKDLGLTLFTGQSYGTRLVTGSHQTVALYGQDQLDQQAAMGTFPQA